MPIIQVNLDIPDNTYANILNGTEQLYGLVKDNRNRIRKHLPKVHNFEERKNSPKNLKTIGFTFLGLAALTSAYFTVKHISKNKTAKKSKYVDEFRLMLNEYLRATKEGSVSKEEVDNLISALNNISINNVNDLYITPAELNQLVESIFEYTKSLAFANLYNEINITPYEHNSSELSFSQTLSAYLMIQKQIIESVV